MRNFRFYTETEPGLIERKTAEQAVSPEALAALAQGMVRHYSRLWARPGLAELKAQRFEHVVSVGGGHPHLEASLNAAAITVADPLAAAYEAAADAYRAVWPDAPPVSCRRCDHAFNPEVMEGADLVVFCHVLEHMPRERAAKYLRGAPDTAGILIYGPNADTMHADNWLHALPVHEHLWIGGLEWTRGWAEKASGRKAAIAMSHDLDLLIWLPPAPAKPKARSRKRSNPEA